MWGYLSGRSRGQSRRRSKKGRRKGGEGRRRREEAGEIRAAGGRSTSCRGGKGGGARRKDGGKAGREGGGEKRRERAERQEGAKMAKVTRSNPRLSDSDCLGWCLSPEVAGARRSPKRCPVPRFAFGRATSANHTRVLRDTRGLRRRWRLRFQRSRLSIRWRGFASPAAAYQGGVQRFPRLRKWLHTPVAVRGSRPP